MVANLSIGARWGQGGLLEYCALLQSDKWANSAIQPISFCVCSYICFRCIYIEMCEGVWDAFFYVDIFLQ